MKHKVSIKIDFIIEKEEDVCSFETISESIKQAFINMESYEKNNFKLNLDIESIPKELI